MATCRCGHSGDGPHPCHGDRYRCGKPAQQYFYDPSPVALSGMQAKVQMRDTWACPDCWNDFKTMLDKVRGSHVKGQAYGQ